MVGIMDKKSKSIVRFNDYELEIAIVTYNRVEFIKKWIELCGEDVIDRNIRLSIYDSSTNDETEKYIEELNLKRAIKIDYYHIDPEIEIGYKPMLPILASSAKYVWVSGDSRYHDFNELDQKVFPYIKANIDYILLYTTYNEKHDGKIYTDLTEFIHDCFISSTCIGLSIYKTIMFDVLKRDNKLMEECDKKFRNNYGFGWLGYFYTVFAKGKNKAVFTVVNILSILPQKKKQIWAKRFYECWVKNLCEIADFIPDIYQRKDMIPYETWKRMKLDSFAYCYRARVSGGLTPQIFQEYKMNGMLSRVTKKNKRVEFFAKAPLLVINIIYFFYTIGFYFCRGIQKVRRMWRVK